MGCNTDIGASFELDCTKVPTKGIEQSVTLMNRNDIDFSGIVFNADGVTVEALPLKSGGKRAYLMGGVKTLLNATATRIVNDDTFDTFNHSINAYIADLSPANLAEIKAFHNGAEITAVVQFKYTGVNGTGSTKYKIYGLDVGMIMTEAVFDPNENGGLPFTLANNEDNANPQFPYAFFLTDEATTDGLVAALQTPTP